MYMKRCRMLCNSLQPLVLIFAAMAVICSGARDVWAVPIVDLQGPYEGSEGGLITLSASATGVAPLLYEWDFGDGTPIASGVDLTNPTHVYGDNDMWLVTLSVTDGLGEHATDTCAWSIINNVDPTLESPPPQTVVAGEVVDFALAFADVLLQSELDKASTAVSI